MTNQNNPNEWPNTVRPGDPVPPDSVIGTSPLWGGGPVQPPKPPKKPMRKETKTGWAVFGGLGAVALIAVALSPNSANDAVLPPSVVTSVDNGPTPDPVVTPTNEPSPKPSPKVTHKPQPQRTVPVAKDFTLSVKTLSKKCFGSAGCNVTYRVLVAYDGPALDPSKSYEVTYEVRGGEDGPEINTLTVEDGQSTVQDEEFLSTKSSRSKVTAVATSVDES